jgi:hypothetical protein
MVGWVPVSKTRFHADLDTSPASQPRFPKDELNCHQPGSSNRVTTPPSQAGHGRDGRCWSAVGGWPLPQPWVINPLTIVSFLAHKYQGWASNNIASVRVIAVRISRIVIIAPAIFAFRE